MDIFSMGFASKFRFRFLFIQVCIFMGFIYLYFWQKIYPDCR